MASQTGRRAVVIGASVAGLLAARVLSDTFDEVLVLDRDVLCDDGRHRGGVPQSRHAHALLAGGLAALETLFPGIREELRAAGGSIADATLDVSWFAESAWLRRGPSGIECCCIGRPRLESIVRARVRRMTNVRFVEGTMVRELVAVSDGRRILGVRTDRDTETLLAELTVDASGRGSLSPRWLEGLGYARPVSERIEIGLRYTTRTFLRRGTTVAGGLAACVAPSASFRRGGGAFVQEDGRFLVTLFSHFEAPAPLDLTGFIAFAASLEHPALVNAIRGAEPAGEAFAYHVPASVRRHYERLRKFPAGYLITGDALAAFNPMYGQGMSVAALEALALRDVLRGGGGRIARRFFARASRIIDAAWSVVATNDIRLSRANRDSFLWRARSAYISAFLRAAHRDMICARAFLRVTNMLAPPRSLLGPALASRTVWHSVLRVANTRHHSIDEMTRPSSPQVSK